MTDELEFGPTYSDSILLDRRKYDDTSEVVSLRDGLFASLRTDFPNMRYVSDHREVLTLVLINLLYAELLERTPYVAYSRDNSQFGPGTRYKAIGVGRTPLQRTTRWLAQQGFVSEKLGYNFLDSGVAYVTRMRATEKLKELFNIHGWSAVLLKADPPKEPIVLRDSDGNDLPLPVSPETNAMKEAARKINDYLSGVRIEIDGKLRPVGYYRRIFNRGSFDYGGRWYGHWIQNEKNDTKKVGELNTRERRIKDGRLLLNGEPTIEYDYHAMHLTMLYHKLEVDPDYIDSNGICDGYGLADYGFGREFRPLIKNICMYYINNPSKKSAIATINEKLFTDELREFQNVNVREVMNAFEAAHVKVRDLFFQERGPRLQRIDSDIVERIMLHFVDRDIPCLSIHDSFIVPRKHKNLLGRVMTSAWHEVIGFGRPLFTE